jgi:hypothetical protein
VLLTGPRDCYITDTQRTGNGDVVSTKDRASLDSQVYSHVLGKYQDTMYAPQLDAQLSNGDTTLVK